MTITIRPVARRERTQWLRLREAVYDDVDNEFHAKEMEIILNDDTKQCLLAFDSAGDARGMIELSLRNNVDGCLTSPVGYIEGIYVDAPLRGKGISRRLMDDAEVWFRHQGCQEIATDAETDNETAQQFHEHMGFKETYRIVQYRKAID